MVAPIYTYKNIHLHYNNEMFNNTSTVGPSQKATVIVTNYMGTLVLFLKVSVNYGKKEERDFFCSTEKEKNNNNNNNNKQEMKCEIANSVEQL